MSVYNTLLSNAGWEGTIHFYSIVADEYEGKKILAVLNEESRGVDVREERFHTLEEALIWMQEEAFKIVLDDLEHKALVRKKSAKRFRLY